MGGEGRLGPLTDTREVTRVLHSLRDLFNLVSPGLELLRSVLLRTFSPLSDFYSYFNFNYLPHSLGRSESVLGEGVLPLTSWEETFLTGVSFPDINDSKPLQRFLFRPNGG